MIEHDLLRVLVGSLSGAGDPVISGPGQVALDGIAGHAGDHVWAALVDEAEHHGVAPLIGPLLADWGRRHPGRLPESVGLRFAVLASRHRRAALERERCIDQLITAFDAAGLRMVLLKGACLGHLVYPSPALRPMADIDCLVAPDDAARAAALARAHGFTFAARHVSRFAGRMHHLPSATREQNGFSISLEIHTDAMSTDEPDSLTLASRSDDLRPFARGNGPAGLAFGHIDMLRHLTRHALEPARRLRLIHLLDIARYQVVFRDEIDRARIRRQFPGLAVALEMIAMVFSPAPASAGGDCARAPRPGGVGLGMTPLSELLSRSDGAARTLAALFDPPPWWLHAYYGVPADKSLWPCRMVRHPARLTVWIVRRLLAAAGPDTGAAAQPAIIRGTQS